MFIYIINSVDKTKFSCITPTDAVPQFLRKPIPSILKQSLGPYGNSLFFHCRLFSNTECIMKEFVLCELFPDIHSDFKLGHIYIDVLELYVDCSIQRIKQWMIRVTLFHLPGKCYQLCHLLAIFAFIIQRSVVSGSSVSLSQESYAIIGTIFY